MKQITVIRITLLFSLALMASCSRQQQENFRPNIIFLLCDDLRWDAMGWMGNRYCITPHIDSMAHESVVFLNAYHTSPICKPSRSTIMLGQYLGTHGSGFDHPTRYNITRSEFEMSYPAILRNAGYFTGFIGKFGFAVGGEEKVPGGNLENRLEYMPVESFDRWYGFPGQGSYRPAKNSTFNGHENPWNAGHLTEWMGYQAIDFIGQAVESGKPFCLSISFKAPHAPFDPDRRFRSLYDTIEIPRMINDLPLFHAFLPAAVREKSRNADWYFGRTEPYRKDWHIERDKIYQAFIRNYYALISGLDDVVGRIRRKLDSAGVSGKTVVIFTSDNGFFCGSRQLMGKALLYDESARAPMIVYDPRIIEDGNGRWEYGLISHVDIAPTILDLAGLESPSEMQGKSFLPIVRNETDEIHEAVYGENNFDNFQPLISQVEDPGNYLSIRSKFVRTRDFKFIRYHECRPVVEELWDMQVDSLESVNLVADSAYGNILNEMRRKLDIFESQYVRYENSMNQ